MVDDSYIDREEKAAYNQSANITQMLGYLLGAYVVHMNRREYEKAVKAIQRIHDIISPKIKEPEIEKYLWEEMQKQSKIKQ